MPPSSPWANLSDFGAIVVAGAVMISLTRRLKVPGIMACILAGLLLGPVLGLVEVSPLSHTIAEVGTILLLFLVGLELSLVKLRDIGRVAVVAGLGQVVFTAVGGFGLNLLLGYRPVEALLIATALTFSSTVVVVKLLEDKGELNALYGRVAVGIFLVQDLVVIVALTMLAGLSGERGLDPADLLEGLAGSFAGMAVLLGVAVLSSRYLLPRPAAWMARSSEGFLVWSLVWCFAFVAGARQMGLSPEIGAFLAGLSLAQLPFNENLRLRVRPLMNFAIAIFFVVLGVQMELGAALDRWGTSVLLSLFVLVGNPLIFLVLIARCGYSERTAFLAGVTVAQISEFSFIFIAMAARAGLVDHSAVAVTALVGLVTIAGSAYMILYNEPLHRWFHRRGLLRWLRAPEDEKVEVSPHLHREGHVVVVGMNAMGRKLAQDLMRWGAEVVAVDTDHHKLEGLSCTTVLGSADHLEILREADAETAGLVITALRIEDSNRLLVRRCRDMGVPVAVHVFDRSVGEGLEELPPEALIQPKEAGYRVLVEHLGRLGVAVS